MIVLIVRVGKCSETKVAAHQQWRCSYVCKSNRQLNNKNTKQQKKEHTCKKSGKQTQHKQQEVRRRGCSPSLSVVLLATASFMACDRPLFLDEMKLNETSENTLCLIFSKKVQWLSFLLHLGGCCLICLLGGVALPCSVLCWCMQLRSLVVVAVAFAFLLWRGCCFPSFF